MKAWQPNIDKILSAGTIVDPSQLAGVNIPPLEWFVDGLIPHKTVTLLSGDGGLGKSLLMQQLATHATLGINWLGLEIRKCKAFGLFCEDSNEELWRRQDKICKAAGYPLEAMYRFNWLSGEGIDPILMEFESGDRGRLSQLFDELVGFMRKFEPELIIIDTAADTFAGDENRRTHVRNFVNRCLKAFAQEFNATVILTSHPSRMGMADGSGLSGSTAWNNSVRSRLYLTRPMGANDSDIRVLESKKSNYGPAGSEIRLKWCNGAFHNMDKFITTDPADKNLQDEACYLKSLQVLTERNQRASLQKNQAAHAPKLMMPLTETTRGISKVRLEQAQNRLLGKRVIANIASEEEKIKRLAPSLKIVNLELSKEIIDKVFML